MNMIKYNKLNKTAINYNDVLSFYRGHRVLVTGNTGFKGSWLTRILLLAGARVIGYSMKPPTEPSLYDVIFTENISDLTQYYADVRNLAVMKEVFQMSKPDIVIHLAAQPIVRDSYKDPVGTYSTNVMGTVNICECVRLSHIDAANDGLGSDGWSGVKSFLNVTTDKVYKNNEWEYGYREDDLLDGFDPYSNSKSCSELVTHSYKESFIGQGISAISTARAGNVIGGGDLSSDRIIPDCVKAICNAREFDDITGRINVRNPYSIRPYQHVLEPLFMYLTIAMKQYENHSFAGYYNVGPDDCDCITTGELVSLFCEEWNTRRGSLPELKWCNKAEENAPYEANFLKLDCSRIKSRFGWNPRWHIVDAIKNTVWFTNIWLSGGDVREEMDREILEYIG